MPTHRSIHWLAFVGLLLTAFGLLAGSAYVAIAHPVPAYSAQVQR